LFLNNCDEFIYLLADAQKRGLVTLRTDEKSGTYVIPADKGPIRQT
jgi:hypothetical protein